MEIAEIWIASSGVTKSVSSVFSLWINNYWAYLPQGANATCVKDVQFDNTHMNGTSTTLLHICWLRKATDADDEINTPFHPTHVRHFGLGENDRHKWVGRIVICELLIWDGIDTS